MDLPRAMDLAREVRRSVFVTMRRNARPQLSNVVHVVGNDGVIRISTTADRAKYRNVRREPWAALHVTREDFFAYAVIEGAVELSPVASEPGDATVEALVEYYRQAVGEHSDWDDYRRAMVAECRLVVSLSPERAYGMP